MKKIFIILVVITSLFGCASFETAISDFNSALSEAGSSKSQGVYFNPMMEFSVFYATNMLLTGYGFEDSNFREGEGITWKVANVNKGEEITVKRALLKDMDNGSSWWQLSSDIDGQEQYYEMLIDDDMNILKARYRDSESNEIKELNMEEANNSSNETNDETEQIGQDSYGEYSVGKETVKTKAGSFKAEHLVFKNDEADNTEFVHDYWLTDKVPGTCVKYIYNNISENETMTGEVIDIRGGYRTQLESY